MTRREVAPVVDRMPVTRVVSTSDALDALAVPDGVVALRTAADEMLLLGNVAFDVADPHAIVVLDTGWAGAWLDNDAAEPFLMAECEWELPSQRPAFAQGMVSHLAAKLWFEEDRTLILVPAPMAQELAERVT